jgi:hypothetical protein
MRQYTTIHDEVYGSKPMIYDIMCGFIYSQTCVQRPPLGPIKSGRCLEVVVIRGVNLKIF